MATKNVNDKSKARDFSRLMNDTDVEEQGVWWEDPDSGMRMLIASRNAPSIDSFHSRLLARQSALLTTASPEAIKFAQACETKALAMCIKEWEFVPDPDDLNKDLPHNFDNAVRLLSHNKWRKLRNTISQFARNDAYYASPEAAAELIAGN